MCMRLTGIGSQYLDGDAGGSRRGVPGWCAHLQADAAGGRPRRAASGRSSCTTARPDRCSRPTSRSRAGQPVGRPCRRTPTARPTSTSARRRRTAGVQLAPDHTGQGLVGDPRLYSPPSRSSTRPGGRARSTGLTGGRRSGPTAGRHHASPLGGLTPACPNPADLSALSTYDRAWLAADLIAGLTLWGLVTPEAMAYAGVAGLPPQAGLYTLARLATCLRPDG